jgi:hypothetical protein
LVLRHPSIPLRLASRFLEEPGKQVLIVLASL